MTKVLVTGGAGYIGSHTCKELARRGYSPIVLDNLSEGHREFVKWGELVEGDVRDTPLLVKTIQQHSIQSVIHFAASAYVGASNNKPQHYYDNNVVGSLSLVDAMQQTACRELVFSSTCAVYGEVQQLPITLEQATKPINPYGRTKLMVEQILEDASKAYDLSCVALRYFNAAGADADGDIGERHQPEPHLIPNIIEAGLAAAAPSESSPASFQPMEIFGNDYETADGTCVRDYIHVTDLANAHVLALKFLSRQGNRNQVHKFNLGAGQGTSNKQVIEMVEQELGVTVPHVFKPRRLGDPAILYADISHTLKDLAWKPHKSDMQTIISSAIAWSKSEQSNK